MSHLCPNSYLHRVEGFKITQGLVLFRVAIQGPSIYQIINGPNCFFLALPACRALQQQQQASQTGAGAAGTAQGAAGTAQGAAGTAQGGATSPAQAKRPGANGGVVWRTGGLRWEEGRGGGRQAEQAKLWSTDRAVRVSGKTTHQTGLTVIASIKLAATL